MNTQSASAAAPSSFTPRLLEAIRSYGTLGIFIVLVVVAALWSDAFLTERNLMNVVRQVASGAGIMAVGMLFFFVNIIYSLFAGKQAADNPWGEGATTLEWTLSSPPPFHQFNELPRIA